MPRIEDKELAPWYSDQTEWYELDNLQVTHPWPDQHGKKGRKRAIKWGHIIYTVQRGIQARVAEWDEKYGPPFSPVYRTQRPQTMAMQKFRLRSEYHIHLPEGTWWSHVHHVSGVAGQEWNYLLLAYEPPYNLEDLRGTWGLPSVWLNGMINEWNEKEAKKDEEFYAENPEIAAMEAELLRKQGYEPES